MLMNSSQLICDLFGKERKLKANLIIKISNKVSSIVIKIFLPANFFKQTSFWNQALPARFGDTRSRAVNYLEQLLA